MYENRYLKNLHAGEYNLRYLHIYVKTSFMVTKIHLHKYLLNYLMKASDADLVQVEKWIDPKCGKSTGRIGNSDSLLRAVDFLVNHSEVNAVAVVARFPDDDDTEDLENYRQGKVIFHCFLVQFVSSFLSSFEIQSIEFRELLWTIFLWLFLYRSW